MGILLAIGLRSESARASSHRIFKKVESFASLMQVVRNFFGLSLAELQSRGALDLYYRSEGQGKFTDWLRLPTQLLFCA